MLVPRVLAAGPQGTGCWSPGYWVLVPRVLGVVPSVPSTTPPLQVTSQGGWWPRSHLASWSVLEEWGGRFALLVVALSLASPQPHPNPWPHPTPTVSLGLSPPPSYPLGSLHRQPISRPLFTPTLSPGYEGWSLGYGTRG